MAAIHASPAAIAPLAGFYKEHGPEFELTNFLDDGLMRLFARADQDAVESRMTRLVRHAAAQDGARLAVVACSAAPRAMLRLVAAGTGIQVLKIDEPLAYEAVRAGPRAGMVVTFAASRGPVESLLHEVAEEADLPLELETVVKPEAYSALLAGDSARHDELVMDSARRLATRNDCVVLSQISMVRIAARLRAELPVPVLDALGSSLAAVRAKIGLV